MKVVLSVVSMLFGIGTVVLAQDCQHDITSLKIVGPIIQLQHSSPTQGVNGAMASYKIETNGTLSSNGWLVATQQAAVSNTTIWTESVAGLTSKFYRVSNGEGRCATVVTPRDGTTTGMLPVVVHGSAGAVEMSLLVDGNKFVTLPGNDQTINLPTETLSNGVHQLQAMATWPSSNGELPPQAISGPVSVTVANPISVEWYGFFGGNPGQIGQMMPVKATLVSNMYWRVDVLNPSNVVLWSMSGYGNSIDVQWDSTSQNDDTAYVVQITASTQPPGGFSMAAAATIPPQVKYSSYKEVPWNTGQTYFGRQYFNGGANMNVTAINQANAILGFIAGDYPVVDNAVHEIRGAADWASMIAWVKDPHYEQNRATQLHLISHSKGPNGLGFSQMIDGSGITTTNVMAELGNTAVFDPVKGMWVIRFRRPTKFVSIYACGAGNGDWANAFGIPSTVFNYGAIHGKRRGFLSFSTYVGLGSLIGTGSKYNQFMIDFYSRWAQAPFPTFGQALLAAISAKGILAQDVVVYGDLSLVWTD